MRATARPNESAVPVLVSVSVGNALWVANAKEIPTLSA